MAFAINGTIKFKIVNTVVTDEATYTYSSSVGDAVNFTLLVEGISNDYIMLYVVVFVVVVFSPLPVFTPEGTIGLPSLRQSAVCQSVCLSAKNLDPLIT